MAIWKKDPEQKPDHLSAEDKEDTYLMSTAGVQNDASNRSKGIKSPGWILHREIETSTGIRYKTEILGAFKNSEGYEDIPSDFDIFVDSVAGDDGNAGTSISAPLQTLGAAQTAALAFGDGVKIGVVAGSEFVNDPLDLSTLTGITLEGTGDLVNDGLPVFRGSSVYVGDYDDSTDRADAHTNVYSFEVTTDRSGPISIFEDGVPLKALAGASGIAGAQAEAGTMVVPSVTSEEAYPPAGTYTVYIHPRGSTDPRSDGKVYKYTHSGPPTLGYNPTMRNLRIDEHVARNGVTGFGQALIENCLFYNTSPIHHCLMDHGAYRNCAAIHEYDDLREGAIILEFYLADGRGKTATWDTCVVKAVENSGQGQRALGGHISGTVNLFDSATYTNCTLIDCSIYDYLSATANIVNLRQDGDVSAFGTQTLINLTDPWIVGGISAQRWMNLAGTNCRVVADGVRFYGDATVGVLANLGNLSSITNSVFVRDGTAGSMARVLEVAPNSAISLDGVIFDDAGLADYLYGIDASQASETVSASDNNQYWGGAKHRIGGVTYSGLPALQGIGLDLNSAIGNPGVVDAAGGDFSLTAPLATGAGVQRFPTYTPAPANATAAEAWLVSL